MTPDRTYERIVISAILPVIVARAIYLVNEEEAQKWLQGMKNIPQWANGKDLFNIAWITTLAASGLAAALVYNAATVEKGATKNPALVSYGAQLGLCWLYVLVIYGLQSLDLGLAVILLLDAVALITTISFYNISLAAAALNAPIILWLLTVTGLVLRCRSTMAAALGDKVAIVE